MLRINYVMTLGLLSLSFQALSFSLPPGHLVVQGGGFWSTPGKNQHININTLIGNQYTVTDGHDSNGLFGLGYFLSGVDNQRFALDYGVNGFYLPKIKVNGTIIQENQFANLGYSYGITQVPVYALAKVIMPYSERFGFSADLGIGPNFVQTSGVNEWPINGSNALPDHAFSGGNNAVFSATAGVGLRINKVFNTMALEVGYRYFYLGKGRFQKRSNEWINTLTTGNNDAHAVVCSLIF